MVDYCGHLMFVLLFACSFGAPARAQRATPARFTLLLLIYNHIIIYNENRNGSFGDDKKKYFVEVKCFDFC